MYRHTSSLAAHQCAAAYGAGDTALVPATQKIKDSFLEVSGSGCGTPQVY